MKDNRYYYDEQIKAFYYQDYYKEFLSVKKELKDTSLLGLLSLQTKNSLVDIAKRIELKGYSKLSKGDLAQFINININERINDIINEITYGELKFIESLLYNKVNKYVFNIEDLTKIGGLSSLGILHKINIEGNYNLVIADEFKLVIKELLANDTYMSNLKERSIGIAYIDGLMAHYGVLLGSELYKIVNEDSSNIFVKEDSDFYYNYLFRSYEAFAEANSFIHPYVFSPEDICKELSIRHTINYDFNDNIDYLINLGNDYKFGFNEEINKLKSILINRGINIDVIDNVLMELVFYIKNDLGTMSIVQLLEENGFRFEDEEDNNEIISVLAEIYNSTPMWILKGFTPREIEQRRKRVIVKEKKPGRNDPCLCGSGKKYKKCCGRS